MAKDVYRFRVGQCDLSFVQVMKENEQVVDTMYLLCPKNAALDTVYATYKGGLLFADVYQAKHVCLLLNRDLFEYGPDGWHRHQNVGRDGKYDWDALGTALNGTTYVSPDRLETAIKNSGEWAGSKYHFTNHNCQSFVQFCMRALGCPESMIIKKGPVYRDQRRKLK